MTWKTRPKTPGSERVFRNMMTLLAGGAAAKLAGFAAMPIITRIYTPEEIGVLGTFTSIVAVLSPLATLRYATALPVPRRDSTAANLFVLSVATLSIFVVTLSIFSWLAGSQILSVLSLDPLTPYLPLVTVAVFCTALYEVLTLWGTRKRAFRILAASQAAQAVTGNAIKIALGLFGFKLGGLLLGQIVQQGGAAFALLRICTGQIISTRRHISIRRICALASSFSDAPRFRLPSQFLLMASMQSPVLFSAHLFGMEATGQLSLALGVLAVPLSLLGTTTGNAYFSEISAVGRNNAERVLEITRSVTKRLLLLSVLPALALLFTGPWLFSLIFGFEWDLAGRISQILSIYLVFQFISSPLGNALTLFRRQDLLLSMNIARFAITAAIFLASTPLDLGLESTLATYSLFLSIHYILSNRIIFKVIKKAC
jgi:Membrane protein involved in the export of O-antigen and teichoic acid